MNELPNWYKLVYFWCKNRIPKGYGLTIPFLIGATKIKSIEILLYEISLTKTPQSLILRFCEDLKEYVISLDDSLNPIAFCLTGEKNLFYDDDKLDSFKSFDNEIKFLNEKYYETIKNEHYSKNKKTEKWESFTSYDHEFIYNALK